MAIRRVNPTGVATGGSGADYGANACGTINEASAAATDTYLKASTDTVFTGLTFACAKGTAATPNRYLDVATGALSSYGALIDVCETGWAAGPSTDIGTPAYVASLAKNGGAVNKLRLTFDASPKTTTLQAYKVVSNLDLSAYQSITFWMQNRVGATPIGALVIKLCTGNDGSTGVVATLTTTEAYAALSSTYFAVTLDNGSALPSGINSIGIYTGAAAPAATTEWYFDTFYATISGFDLNSVLHKSFNYRGVSWAPNTAIALNEIRVPTFGARTPLVYKCVFAGTTAATEYFTDADGQSKPIWDKAYLPAMGDFAAQRVTDNSVIWECQGDDEAYYMWTIKSLDFTANAGKGRIEIDNHTGNVGADGRGYYGTNETVAFSYLTPYLYPMAAIASTTMDSVGASGTDAVPRSISGGYNTSDVVVGLTLISGRNGLGKGLSCASRLSTKLSGIGWVRTGIAVDTSSNPNWTLLRMVVGLSLTTYAINQGSFTSAILIMQYFYGVNAGVSGSFIINRTIFRGSFNNKVIGCLSTVNYNPAAQLDTGCAGMQRGFEASNNAGYGIMTSPGMIFINCKTTLNAVAPFSSSNTIASRCKNLSSSESIIIQTAAATYGYGAGMLIQNFNGTTGDNRAYYPSMGQATYNSTTHVWTIAVNSVNATQQIPLRHKVGSLRCDTANVPYAISLAVNPTNTNLVAQLKVLANTLAGVSYDTYAQSSGAGLQTLTVTITPLEVGIVEIYLDCYLTDTTLTYTLAYDLDSLAATKNAVALRIYGIGDELFGDELVRADTNATFPAANTIDPLAPACGWAGEIVPAMDVPNINKVAPSDTLRGVNGTMDLPAITSVVPPDTLEGVTGAFDEAGRNTNPGILNVRSGVNYLNLSASYSGVMDLPNEDDVRNLTTFDSATKTGNLVLPLENEVKFDTNYGSSGTEFTGSLVGGGDVLRIRTILPGSSYLSGGGNCNLTLEGALATQDTGYVRLRMPNGSFEIPSVTSWSDTNITFIYPISTFEGNGNLIVVNSSGTMDTWYNAFTYYPDPSYSRPSFPITPTQEPLEPDFYKLKLRKKEDYKEDAHNKSVSEIRNIEGNQSNLIIKKEILPKKIVSIPAQKKPKVIITQTNLTQDQKNLNIFKKDNIYKPDQKGISHDYKGEN